MAKNRSTERLRRLKKTPLYILRDSGAKRDWYRDPERPDIANRMSWLEYSHRDMALRRAFDFFDLDPSHPGHWRLLIMNLAFVLFPDPRSGTRTDTIQKDALLLARSREFPNTKSETEMFEKLVQKYRRDYTKKQIPNLRKRLKVARRNEAKI